MTTRSIHEAIKVSRGISPAAATTDNTAWTSQIVDMQGYDATEFIGCTGSLADADATFAITVTVGDASNLSDGVSYTVAQGDTSFTFAADDSTFKLAVVTTYRYARVTVTPSNNTGNAFLAGMWVQSRASQQPTS